LITALLVSSAMARMVALVQCFLQRKGCKWKIKRGAILKGDGERVKNFRAGRRPRNMQTRIAMDSMGTRNFAVAAFGEIDNGSFWG
jgi:hypothetical protein